MLADCLLCFVLSPQSKLDGNDIGGLHAHLSIFDEAGIVELGKHVTHLQ